MGGHTESMVAAVESVPKGVFVMLSPGRPVPLVLVIIVEIIVVVVGVVVVIAVVHFSILVFTNLSLIVTVRLRTRTDACGPIVMIAAETIHVLALRGGVKCGARGIPCKAVHAVVARRELVHNCARARVPDLDGLQPMATRDDDCRPVSMKKRVSARVFPVE